MPRRVALLVEISATVYPDAIEDVLARLPGGREVGLEELVPELERVAQEEEQEDAGA